MYRLVSASVSRAAEPRVDMLLHCRNMHSSQCLISRNVLSVGTMEKNIKRG